MNNRVLVKAKINNAILIFHALRKRIYILSEIWYCNIVIK